VRYVPRVLVTDKLTSYGVAHRRLMRSVEHRRSKYLNNRAENSHFDSWWGQGDDGGVVVGGELVAVLVGPVVVEVVGVTDHQMHDIVLGMQYRLPPHLRLPALQEIVTLRFIFALRRERVLDAGCGDSAVDYCIQNAGKGGGC
jgi:hypothetical protein